MQWTLVGNRHHTRRGPVLSFFTNQMFATMVETDQTRLWFVNLWVKATVTGTSFAAPWITRKMAYLIHVMGLSREVAKALIIDSAAGWDRQRYH